MKDWIKEATKMFHNCRITANEYGPTNKDVKTLALINAGGAIALSVLLEKFGAKPETTCQKE